MVQDEKGLIKQVWTNDDVSPASFLYNYRDSNIVYEWNPQCMTRLLGQRGSSKAGECLEVMVHQDGSVFHVKDHGNFIAHLQSNMTEIKPLRNFTCDTIPFVVHTMEDGEADMNDTFQQQQKTFNPQEMLAPAFMILGQPFTQKDAQVISAIDKEHDDITKSTLMASCSDSVFKEMNVKDLGHFTAYSNQAIKAVAVM